MIDGSRRLRGVLEQLEVFDIDPDELHLYIHLCAPLVEEAAPEVTRQPARAGEVLTLGVGDEEGFDAFVRVPRGPLLMGSAEDDAAAYDDEKPQHPYEIPHDYWIGRYPVTNAEFARFLADDGYADPAYWTAAGWAWRKAAERVAPDGWKDDLAESRPRHPVVGVSWYAAVAYARWLTARLHEKGLIEEPQAVCLPSEAEWEKAARGEYGRIYPWGDDWDPARCNSEEGGPGAPTPVGRYSPEGDSPYGAADMAGNVWEWCATQWVGDYGEYNKREDNDLDGDDRRVVRGGSFCDNRRNVRCAYRFRLNPDRRDRSQGFRVAVAPTASGL
jgi:formylglycine-generating enzyme required for sulfatase activity